MEQATASHPFRRYRGDGIPPKDRPPISRNEDGRYLADPDLVAAVNTALLLGQPLLLEGDPGCGKSSLAWSVASELGLGEVLPFHTRSDHQGRDALYRFDHLLRLYDVQRKSERVEHDPTHYRQFSALGEAIRCAEKESRQRVVLIDEVDKAPSDFPNDLLDEMEQMAFIIPETGESYAAPAPLRPVVIITSNAARQLPEAFLRRCVFHYIEFPGQKLLAEILAQRVAEATAALVEQAVGRFLKLRAVDGLHRQPGTAELIGWVRVLLRAQVDLKELGDQVALAKLPSLGALVKSRDDVKAVRRAAGGRGDGARADGGGRGGGDGGADRGDR